MTSSPCAFFALERRDRGSWLLPVDARLTSGSGALFGGAALGAIAAVVEQGTDRPLVWASAQFVAHVVPPAEVRLSVTELARGRRASQVRVVAHVQGSEVFCASGVAGGRLAGSPDADPVVAPIVPRPADCPPRPRVDRHRGRFMERVDARLALASSDGTAHDGRSALWVRVPDLEPSSATLAVMGDYVPFGLRQVIGDGIATHSLDNTIRVLRPPGTGWVLADVRIHGTTGGFGYGRVHLWDEAGRLLGTASQSFTCRARPDS